MVDLVGKILFLLLILLQATKVLALNCQDRVVIAPPYVKAPAYGDWLIQEAMNHLRKVEKLDCDLFVDPDRAAEFFYYSGISSFFSKPLGEKQIRLIEKNTSANHLLIISQEQDQFFYKLFRIKEERIEYIKRYTQQDSKGVPTRRNSSFVNWLSSLTPNTLALSMSKVYPNYTLADGYRETNRDDADEGPDSFSLSFSKIDSRSAYELFDVSLAFYPSLFYYTIDQDTPIEEKVPTNGTSKRREILHLRSQGLCSSFNGEVSLYWILGTTYTGFGLGPCAIISAQEDRHSKKYGTILPRVFFGHRIFLTQNLYTELGGDMVFSDPKQSSSPNVKDTGVARVSFAFGWYFPDTERRSLRAWNNLFY